MIAFRYVRYHLCYKNQISRDTAFEIQKHVNFLPCKKSPNMEVFLVCKISALGQKRIKNCINSEGTEQNVQNHILFNFSFNELSGIVII